jgi:hypothetical protein
MQTTVVEEGGRGRGVISRSLLFRRLSTLHQPGFRIHVYTPPEKRRTSIEAERLDQSFDAVGFNTSNLSLSQSSLFSCQCCPCRRCHTGLAFSFVDPEKAVRRTVCSSRLSHSELTGLNLSDDHRDTEEGYEL